MTACYIYSWPDAGRWETGLAHGSHSRMQEALSILHLRFQVRTDAASKSLWLTPEAKDAAYGFAACVSSRMLRASSILSYVTVGQASSPSPGWVSQVNRNNIAAVNL